MVDDEPGSDDVEWYPDAESGPAGPVPAPWVVEVVRSLTWTRLASRITGWLAAVGGVVGVAAAVVVFVQNWSGGDDLFSAGTIQWYPALTALLTTAFYVGLLVSASALLRLQAARLEAEVFGEERGDD